MSQKDGCSANPVTSPRATDGGTHPGDRLPADGRDLLGEVCAAPDYDSQFDITVSLPSLIGLPRDFCEALESLGGCSLTLATKLMSSHDCDGSGAFVAGKLCGTEAQKRYYTQTLDA